MVQIFTALISIPGDADSARSSAAVGLTCKGEGECKGDCGAELNRFLAGGPKLIYYNR